MAYKYKTIDLRTVKGIKQAERLKSLGWKIISVGFNTIMLEKKIERTNKNVTKIIPESTANLNVPNNVFIVGENILQSEEIKITFYVDNAGYIWKVGDWITDKPRPSSLHDLYRLTGDTEQIIAFRCRQYFNKNI